MINFLTTMFQGVWPLLAVVVGSLIAFFTHGLNEKRKGRKEAENKQAIDNLQAAKEAKQAHEDNLNADADDIARGL